MASRRVLEFPREDRRGSAAYSTDAIASGRIYRNECFKGKDGILVDHAGKGMEIVTNSVHGHARAAIDVQHAAVSEVVGDQCDENMFAGINLCGGGAKPRVARIRVARSDFGVVW